MRQDTPIYIATVLLERNRWTLDKAPSFAVSEWGQRFHDAGFDGVELWENHLLLAMDEEQAAIQDMACPVVYYNTYAGFGDEDADALREAADWIRRLGAKGCKYNLGKDPSRRETERRNLRAWVASLPEGCMPLCECHGGTMLEDPRDAARFFQEADLPRNGIIVHAMGGDEERLHPWFDLFGPAIRHLHIVLHREPDLAGRLAYFERAGFAGSMTVEFTQGVAEPGENMADLFASAVDDLDTLRAALGA